MRILVFVGVVVALVSSKAGPRAAGCDPAGTVRFICDQVVPEDLFPVPGGEWVLSSGMGPNGAIRAIRIRDKSTIVLFPSGSAKVRPDTKTYPSCPGPIDLSNRERFRAHGLYLRPGKGSVHTLYLVHHGSRESVEIFELDGRATPPVLTWIGCAVAPERMWLNSVVGLPDGGFVVTNFSPLGQIPDLRTKIMSGANNGALWEWHTASGWQEVPGSSTPGPNGLELSSDGRWLYIGAWGSESVVRLSRGQTPVKKDAVPVGFRVDNIRWAPDGTMLAAGQGGDGPSEASHVARVNFKRMTAQELVRYPFGDTFSMGTVAIEVGRELWVGTYRGNRIAIFPAGPQ